MPASKNRETRIMPTTLLAGARIKTTAKRRIALPGINAPARKARNAQPEEAEQKKVIAWRNANQDRETRLRWLNGSLNGVKLSKHLAGKMRELGMTSGISDLELPVAAGGYCGLKIEMKIKPNKPSPAQVEFLEFSCAQGYLCRVCWSAEEAIGIISMYLAGDYERMALDLELNRLRNSFVAPKAAK